MKKRHFPYLSRLSGEAKRRGVYAALAAYTVMAWILLQVGEVVFEPLGFPAWAMTALVIAVIAGFPLAIVVSWMFNITAKGFRRDSGAHSASAFPNDAASIAVLPFDDLSEERNQGYFCEGVAEEILNALTKIEKLHVAARSSSFQYAKVGGDVRDVGRRLGVKTILEGSVRKSGDQLRITAKLVNVADGYHLWSQSFDEQLEDVFKIQDAIARSIAQSLLDTITPGEYSAIKTTKSRDITAYEFYLRGRYFINRFRKTEIEFARQMFRQALDADPEFALAWAGYADCFSLLTMYADPNPSYVDEATRASERALKLESGLAEAHASRGLAYLVSEEHALAEAEFKAALELNPRLYEAYYYCARTKFHQGELVEAAELFEKASAVNPAEYQARCLRAQILRGLGKEKAAKEAAEQNVAVIEQHLKWNPDDLRALHLGAGSMLLLGNVDMAKQWLKRALEIDPDDSILLYNVACNFATMGEVEDSLTYLEAAVDNGMVNLAWISNDNDLEKLRTHPRYHALIRRLEKRLETMSN